MVALNEALIIVTRLRQQWQFHRNRSSEENDKCFAFVSFRSNETNTDVNNSFVRSFSFEGFDEFSSIRFCLIEGGKHLVKSLDSRLFSIDRQTTLQLQMRGVPLLNFLRKTFSTSFQHFSPHPQVFGLPTFVPHSTGVALILFHPHAESIVTRSSLK
jgi:hypothetical protein